MRQWAAIGMVAVLLGSGAISGPVAALEQHEASKVPHDASDRRGRGAGFTEVASVIYAEPALNVGAEVGIEAIVFVETGKYLAKVQCPLFTVERDAPETTITAYCETRKVARGKRAFLDVRTLFGESGYVAGCETAPRELRRNERFRCTLDESDAQP
jgi:hypothetical protein